MPQPRLFRPWIPNDVRSLKHAWLTSIIDDPTASRLVGAWRRERDSNPRYPVKSIRTFQARAFNHSAISPFAASKTAVFRLMGGQITKRKLDRCSCMNIGCFRMRLDLKKFASN